MLQKILRFCFIVVLIAACSEDEPEKGLSAYDESVIEYFNEIALGFEFGSASEVTRKWKTDMKIFVGGYKQQELMTELQTIIGEINTLATDGFSASVVTDTLQSNFYIFFGSGGDYVKKFPALSTLVLSNWGLFNVFFHGSNEIYSGYMYVDTDRSNSVEEKHLLREELTQSLGLAKDSNRYPDSIFQESWTTTTEYSDIDKDLVRLLYHPSMQTGLDRSKCVEVLREIILSEK
ncbi:MAG TPA: DUF2927 domain-containing protein [Chryseolinea sp.]|nr:DUF2927 domain-containing protein [Chryseolinea sp.]